MSVKLTLSYLPFLYDFRLQQHQLHGEKLDRYQASSPDRDSSTDFDELDMDDKSFDDEDDDEEKIDVEHDDDNNRLSLPVSLPSQIHADPQSSPTSWLYGRKSQNNPQTLNNPLPQPWALNLSVPKIKTSPNAIRSFGIDDILQTSPLDYSQTGINLQQYQAFHNHLQLTNQSLQQIQTSLQAQSVFQQMHANFKQFQSQSGFQNIPATETSCQEKIETITSPQNESGSE